MVCSSEAVLLRHRIARSKALELGDSFSIIWNGIIIGMESKSDGGLEGDQVRLEPANPSHICFLKVLSSLYLPLLYKVKTSCYQALLTFENLFVFLPK